MNTSYVVSLKCKGAWDSSLLWPATFQPRNYTMRGSPIWGRQLAIFPKIICQVKLSVIIKLNQNLSEVELSEIIKTFNNV